MAAKRSAWEALRHIPDDEQRLDHYKMRKEVFRESYGRLTRMYDDVMSAEHANDSSGRRDGASDEDNFLPESEAALHAVVIFVREDGSQEGKDVWWCMNHGFEELEVGTWSGPWCCELGPRVASPF